MAVPGVPERRGAPDGTDARSVAELAGDLAREMTALVHDEIELAKLELNEKGKRAATGASLFGGSGLLALLGLGCLTACLIAAIQLALPVWLAALILGVAYLGAAGAVTMLGRRQVRGASPPLPEQMIESSKEDVTWLRTQVRSARR